jgi:uncharacterized membrane protein YhaH (DUF805 family)
MARSMQSRIDSLARRDRFLAVALTVLMWIALVFVFTVASTMVPSGGVTAVLLVSLVVLGLFNTASIVQMVRAYAANKDLIYRQDILNLDGTSFVETQEVGEPRV